MQAIEEIKNGEYEEFDTVEEMKNHLLSDKEADDFYSVENQQKILAAIKRLKQCEFVEYSPLLNE